MQLSRKSSQVAAVGALKLFYLRPVPVKPNGNQPASEPWRPVMLQSLGDPTELLCSLSNRTEQPHGAGLSVSQLIREGNSVVPPSKPSKLPTPSSRTLACSRAESRDRSDRLFYRWIGARAVMQSVVPTAAPCRPQHPVVSHQMPRCPAPNSSRTLDGVAMPLLRSLAQGCQASSRLLMFVHRLGTRIAHSGHCRSKKHPAHNTLAAVVAVCQPCGILTAPPSSVAVLRRSDPLHPGPVNTGGLPELRSHGYSSAQLPWIAREIWHVPN